MPVASECQRATASTLFALVGWFLLVLLTVYYVIINYGVWRKDHKIFTQSIKRLQPFSVWSLTASQYFVMFRQKQSLPQPLDKCLERALCMRKQHEASASDPVLSHCSDTLCDCGFRRSTHGDPTFTNKLHSPDYVVKYLWSYHPAVGPDVH